MPPVALANPVQAEYRTRILVTMVVGGTTRRFSTMDQDVSGLLFERRIVNDVELHRAFDDPLIGIARVNDLSIVCANQDGLFNGLDLRGTSVTVERYDAFSNERLTEFTGQVLSQQIGNDTAVLHIGSLNLADLQTLLPRRLVTAATFPRAHAEQGLNLPIPIVFGVGVGPLQLPYVNEDLTNNLYDYLLPEGGLTNITVLSDTIGDTLVVVPPAEYTINSTAFPGFTVVRFVKQQLSFNGTLHRIFATGDGLTLERNFARAIQSILSNTTWGLGKSVVTASFDSVAATLDGIGSLFCDGAIKEQRAAIDWISQLLMIRGLRPTKDGTGAYSISVDTEQANIKATFGYGANQPWNNVVSFDGLENTPVAEAVKTLFLDYDVDPHLGQFRRSASRTVLSLGQERRLSNSFIKDATTADKVVDYLAKRLLYGDDRLPITVGQEGRQLAEGDLINFVDPDLGLSTARTFRVTGLRRQLAEVQIEAEGWNNAIYIYGAGTLPPTPPSPTGTDRSRTIPSAVTLLTIPVLNTYQTTDGTGIEGTVTLQYTVPNEPWAQTVVRFRRAGTTAWETAAVSGETGAGLATTINGLMPGISYDYRVSRINNLDSTLEATTDLLAQTAPGTSAIFNNAITTSGVLVNDTTDPWSATEIVRASLTLSTNGGAVAVSAKFQAVMFMAAGGNLEATFWLRKDSISGPLLDLGQIRLDNTGANQVFSVICSAIGYDQNPNATQTYVLVIAGLPGQGGTSQRYRLVVFNLKK